MTVCVRVSSQTQARGDKVVGIEEFCVCVYLCVSFHFKPFFLHVVTDGCVCEHCA